MTRRADAPPIEALLEEGDWVWRLARSLVRSDHDADDIVQETWYAALRQPPHPGGVSAARSAWLTKVVRHAAARLARSRERRAQRELHAARADESPAADRLHERESARSVLVDEVLALPHPYSEVLLLRYFDELSPREVARRLGENRSTIRNQIGRGLELLRVRLTRRRDEVDRPCLLALVPLIPRSSPLPTAWVGVTVVSTKVLVSAAAVIAVLSFGWLMWHQKDPGVAPSVAVVQADSELNEPSEVPSDPPVALAQQNENRQPVHTEGPSIPVVTSITSETVRGRVVDSNGLPVAGAEIWTSDWDLGQHPAGRTAQDGRFQVPRPEGRFEVGARHDEYAPSIQRRFEKGQAIGDKEIVLSLSGGAGRLAVQVVDPYGQPIAAAIVRVGSSVQNAIFPSGEPGRTPPAWTCQTDETGRVSASGLATGTVAVSIRAEGFKYWSSTCNLIASQEAQLNITLRAGAAITGRIGDPAGQPLEGVRVSAGPRRDYDPATVSTKTDRASQYSLRGVPEGDIRVSARSNHQGNVTEELVVAQGEQLVWNAVLQLQQSIRGRVIDDDGQPLQNWLAALIKPGDSGHWLRNSRTDSEGRFELRDPPREAIDLELRSPRLWDTGPVVLLEGVHAGQEELVLRVSRDRMPTAFICGRIMYSDGRPCGVGRSTYVAEDTPNLWKEAATPDGTFRIGSLRPVRYRLFASDNDLSSDDFGEVETASGTTKELGDIVLEPPGTLVVVATPAMTEGITYQLAQERIDERLIFHTWQGLPDRIQLRPGKYVLQARGSRYESERISFHVTSGSATSVNLQLLSRMARVLEFVCPDGAKVSRVDVELRGFEDGALKKTLTVTTDAEGRLISRFELEPGIYTLSAVADNGYKGRLNAMSWAGGHSVPPVIIRLVGD